MSLVRIIAAACVGLGSLSVSLPAVAQDAESRIYGAVQTCPALRSYLRSYPEGRFRADAEARIAKECAAPAIAPQQVAVPKIAPAPVAPADPCVQARADWSAIETSEDTRVLSAFVASLTAGCPVQKSQAESRIELVEKAASAKAAAEAAKTKSDLDQKNLWSLAEKSNSVAVYEEYLRSFPSGAHAVAAKEAIGRLSRPPLSASEKVSGRWTRRQGDCARFYEISAGGGMFEFRFGGGPDKLGSMRKARITNETENAVSIVMLGQQWTFTASSDESLMWDTPITRCFFDRVK